MRTLSANIACLGKLEALNAALAAHRSSVQDYENLRVRSEIAYQQTQRHIENVERISAEIDALGR